MARFRTKYGRIYVERSKMDQTLNVGFGGARCDGFAALPFGKAELLRLVRALGAVWALRGFASRRRKEARKRRAVERRISSAFSGKRGK